MFRMPLNTSEGKNKDMTGPLMPKATAIWLIDNTTLTFEQIGDFCGLHPLEVQALADGEAASGLIGHDPVDGGGNSHSMKLKDAKPILKIDYAFRPQNKKSKTKKGAKYTPSFSPAI
jgi:Uncharacterized protein conserved in bacteria